MERLLAIVFAMMFASACSGESKKSPDEQKTLQMFHECLTKKAERYMLGSSDVEYLAGLLYEACEKEYKAEHGKRVFIGNDDYANEMMGLKLKILGDRNDFFREHAKEAR